MSVKTSIQAPYVVVPITTLAPEPFELLNEIKAVVQPADGGYLATFFDANINASGETQQDAVANLKDMIVGLFEKFSQQPRKKLGPVPRRQLAVLENFMRRARFQLRERGVIG